LLAGLTDVVAVYSRHTHPREASFVPGHSDLDATVVLADDAARDPDRIRALSETIESYNRLHFYLNPQDVRIISTAELDRYTRRFPSPHEILYTPDDWLLLAGREVRKEKARHLSPDQLPWHPEFNKWWQHIMQDYLLVPKPGLEDQYLRVFFRSALRQKLQFLASSGKEIPKPWGHVSDDLVVAAFEDDAPLRERLCELAGRDFWAKDPLGTKTRILQAVFQSANHFFLNDAPNPDLIWDEPDDPSGRDAHANAYDALHGELRKNAELTSLLRGIKAYPIPHFHPYFYQVDLIISDDLPPDQFRDVFTALIRAFKGREFHIGDDGFFLTVMTETLAKSPLVYLGSSYPFLLDHVQRYGEVILGRESRAPKGFMGKEDMVKWSRIFLPYYVFNLGQRIEYSSRSLNFCQLASVRLFLETDQRETDPTVLRQLYRTHFKEETPDERLWNYVMTDKPGRQNRVLYSAATMRLMEECRRVEELLHGGRRRGET
jgi:hypothetical protein